MKRATRKKLFWNFISTGSGRGKHDFLLPATLELCYYQKWILRLLFSNNSKNPGKNPTISSGPIIVPK